MMVHGGDTVYTRNCSGQQKAWLVRFVMEDGVVATPMAALNTPAQLLYLNNKDITTHPIPADPPKAEPGVFYQCEGIVYVGLANGTLAAVYGKAGCLYDPARWSRL